MATTWWDTDHRSEVALFSNDRNLVDRARAHTILAQWIDYPDEQPDEATASWRQMARLTHLLSTTSRVLELPTATGSGEERVNWIGSVNGNVDCRSSKVAGNMEADLSIVETYLGLDS